MIGLALSINYSHILRRENVFPGIPRSYAVGSYEVIEAIGIRFRKKYLFNDFIKLTLQYLTDFS